MNRSIEFGELIQPIAINRERNRWRNSGYIFGWTVGGNHLNPENFHPEASEYLNYLAIDVLSHLECTLRLSGFALYLRLNHICTFSRRGGACTFDSGSGVIVDGELVGIISFVVPCAFPQFPDWGPRISSYTRWIDSIISE